MQQKRNTLCRQTTRQTLVKLMIAVTLSWLPLIVGCNQNRYQPAEWRTYSTNTTLPNGEPTTLPRSDWGTLPGRLGTTLPARSLTTLPGGMTTLPAGMTTLPYSDLTSLPRRGMTTLPTNSSTTLPRRVPWNRRHAAPFGDATTLPRPK